LKVRPKTLSGKLKLSFAKSKPNKTNNATTNKKKKKEYGPVDPLLTWIPDPMDLRKSNLSPSQKRNVINMRLTRSLSASQILCDKYLIENEDFCNIPKNRYKHDYI